MRYIHLDWTLCIPTQRTNCYIKGVMPYVIPLLSFIMMGRCSLGAGPAVARHAFWLFLLFLPPSHPTLTSLPNNRACKFKSSPVQEPELEPAGGSGPDSDGDGQPWSSSWGPRTPKDRRSGIGIENYDWFSFRGALVTNSLGSGSSETRNPRKTTREEINNALVFWGSWMKT